MCFYVNKWRRKYMECAWISNFVILETEALLTFCQEEHGVGSEQARGPGRV